MKLKLLLLFLMLSLVPQISHSQLGPNFLDALNNKSNIVSIGIPGLAFRNFNLGYERILTDKCSIAIHSGLFLNRTYPNGFILELGQSPIQSTDLKGNSQVLEFRYYASKEGATRGFYIGALFRRFQFQFEGPTIYNEQNLDLNLDIVSKGIGIQMGIQFKLSSDLTLDWYLLGGTSEFRNKNMTVSSTEPITNGLDIKDIVVNDASPFPSEINHTYEVSPNSIEVLMKDMPLGIRSGFSIGYRF